MSTLNHIGISVKNLEASRSFYEQVFGLQFQKEGEGERPDLGIKFIVLEDAEGNAIELFESDKQVALQEDLMDFSRHGIKHVAFTVDNIEEIVEKAVALGAQVVWQPEEIQGRLKRIAFIKDPDGIALELVELR